MNKHLIITVILVTFGSSCTRQWLDERSNKSLTTPNTTSDLQQMLDNYNLFNGPGDPFTTPQLLEVGSDNHVMQQSTYDANLTFGTQYTNAYIFATNTFEGQREVTSWNIPYKRIFVANLVLDKAATLTTDPSESEAVEGQALFHRANAYYWLSQTFMDVYDSSSATSSLGIPLRLVADPNLPTTRSSMQETYEQLISDASGALSRLPVKGLNPYRPSAPAAAALLARIYLSMGNYERAEHYADTALSMQNELIDYNTLDSLSDFPIGPFSKEVLFADLTYTSVLYPAMMVVDSNLYRSFANNDLRKVMFFKNKSGNEYAFYGSYDGTAALFIGVAADELYLMSAEAKAKLGRTADAMSVLNQLLITRCAAGSFVPNMASSQEEALQQIREERRKELCFRGLRWIDLRRFNKEGAGINLVHEINGQAYTLPANDPKWTYPIPDDIIRLTGIQQNPR